GRYAEARQVADEWLAGLRAAWGGDHPRVAPALRRRADIDAMADESDASIGRSRTKLESDGGASLASTGRTPRRIAGDGGE
ncbi:MAG: hypothetical protein AAGE94_16060, partial [Acidobacteriota bacterium]